MAASQLNLFADSDALTPEARADYDARHQEEKPKPPTASKKRADCVKILRLLRDAGADGVDGVSSLRIREEVPLSSTQRISDLRKDGYDIKCYQPAGSACSLYTLVNKEHRGEKYQ